MDLQFRALIVLDQAELHGRKFVSRHLAYNKKSRLEAEENYEYSVIMVNGYYYVIDKENYLMVEEARRM